MHYFVSYDLNKPKKDYPKLWNALERLGAKRVLKSHWVLRQERPVKAVTLANRLREFIDSDDRLVVVSVEKPGSAAWVNPITDPNTV